MGRSLPSVYTRYFTDFGYMRDVCSGIVNKPKNATKNFIDHCALAHINAISYITLEKWKKPVYWDYSKI